ncbi:MAG: ComEA family DNA-binding protein [Terriglobales bacterium]
MAEKIDLNTAGTRELTQLPGIAKNLAYRIVNHRNRHGYFTAWEELKEVKEFPVERLDEIRSRAVLGSPDGDYPPPRRIQRHLAEEKKKAAGYTKTIRSIRRPDRLEETKREAR